MNRFYLSKDAGIGSYPYSLWLNKPILNERNNYTAEGTTAIFLGFWNEKTHTTLNFGFDIIEGHITEVDFIITKKERQQK